MLKGLVVLLTLLGLVIICTIVVVVESKPTPQPVAINTNPTSHQSSAPHRPAAPQLSSKEVLDTILSCVRNGDTYGAKQYMTLALQNKNYAGSTAIDALQSFSRQQSQHNPECIRNQISGSTTTIIYRVYTGDWITSHEFPDGSGRTTRFRSINDTKFIFGKVADKWLLDDIGGGMGMISSEGNVTYTYGGI